MKHSIISKQQVFGFFSIITFGYLIWNTWKIRSQKNQPDKKEEKKKDESDKSEDGNLSDPDKEQPQPMDVMINMQPDFAPEDLKSQ